MKKKMNVAVVENELREQSVFFKHRTPKQNQPYQDAGDTEEATDEPTHQSVGQQTRQSTGQSTNPSTDPSIDMSAILGRPKAFYITEQQDKELDAAVAQLSQRVQGKINHKIDRSTVMRLILEHMNITSSETIQRLASRLISQLINQLTG